MEIKSRCHESSCEGREQPMPIAICGMGMRLPGGINDSAALYDFLLNKKDARAPLGNSRYTTESFYNPDRKANLLASDHGYTLQDRDLSAFDASMFKIPTEQIEVLDPQQRLLLEVVWEAIESAGETEWKGKEIGCFVGAATEEWAYLNHIELQDVVSSEIAASTDWSLANRISYEYDLKGPSMTVKVACSASGLALHLACQSIQQGECDSSVVAGSSLLLSARVAGALNASNVLSPDGSCKTFDASANGYARADAINALFIKRLDHAIRDGNPVRAVIRGTSTNHDGYKARYMLPNASAHESLIRKAYKNAGLHCEDTAMVECHGTGTAVGDPIEASAIAKVFGEHGVYIGSIKPNLGHSEGAAALTSIMKSVLSLESGTILPNIKFDTPNPRIPFDKAKLSVPVEPTPWPQDRHRRISVNTFGAGGANVHIILDSADSYRLNGNTTRDNDPQTPSTTPRLLAFSAADASSLEKVVENHRTYIDENPASLEDLEFTLLNRRHHLEHRAYGFIDGNNELQISAFSHHQQSGNVAFVFTGQGAQWAQMGKDLITSYGSFRDDVNSMDGYLQNLEDRPSWKLSDELVKPVEESMLYESEYSQPARTAVQLGLVNLLRQWNITPSAVIGHSSGEIAAAYAAGVLNMKEAIIVAFLRGQACKQQTRPGGMATIGLGRSDIEAFLQPGVVAACENSASNTTISGDTDQLKAVMAAIQAEHPDVLVRALQVDMAYHSHHMRDVGDTYSSLISSYISPKSPNVPFYSTVTGTLLPEAHPLGPNYWKDSLEGPVLFHSAMKALLAGGEDDLVQLEIAPHSMLGTPIKHISQEVSKPARYIPTLMRNKNGTECFMRSLGELYLHGLPLQVSKPNASARVLTDLPRYPWNHTKGYWHDTRVIRNYRFPRSNYHDLLGLRTLEDSEIQPTWRILFRPKKVPWVKDHRVQGKITFPAAGYIAMAGEAVMQLTLSHDYTLRDVSFHSAMIVDDESIEISTTLRKQRLTAMSDSVWYEFTISSSQDGATWTRNCTGLVHGGCLSQQPAVSVTSYTRKVSKERWYKTMENVGMNLGPRFVGMDDITADIKQKAASITMTDSPERGESSYPMHPTTMDNFFQFLAVAAHNGQPRLLTSLSLPVYIQEVYVGQAARRVIHAGCALSHSFHDGISGAARGVADGETVFSLKGIKAIQINESVSDQQVAYLHWKPHLDFLDASTLMQFENPQYGTRILMEQFYILCLIEAQHQLEGVVCSQPQLERYYNWIKAQCQKVSEGKNTIVEDPKALWKLSHEKRKQMIENIANEGMQTPMKAGFAAILECSRNIRAIVEGSTDGLSALTENKIWDDLHDVINDGWDYGEFLDALNHLRPGMKILEVGAGTGGLTRKVLPLLTLESGQPLYTSYTYTDVSETFLSSAQEKFQSHTNMEYRMLDISKDPLQQDFEAEQYDLIIASNVLHATASLQQSLSHVRTLLRPSGRLLLNELCSDSKWPNFIMGALPGWWASEDDRRPEEPYIHPTEWDQKLRDAGFAGVESVVYDAGSPYQINGSMITRPLKESSHAETVTLLSGTSISDTARKVEAQLLLQGYQVTHATWGEPVSQTQDVISFIELDEPLFHEIQKDDLRQFLDMVQLLQSQKVLWLTQPAQLAVKDPRFAQVLGVARTIRLELSMAFATMELENSTCPTDQIIQVFERIQQGERDGAGKDTDMEFVYSNGIIQVPRFQWTPLTAELQQAPPSDSVGRLTMKRPGLLQTLEWTAHELAEPAPNSVHVQVHAAGLNFKDVLIAMGSIDQGGFLRLGGEASGFVTAVGSNVTHLDVGDRVMVLGNFMGALASTFETLGSHCVRIPTELSLQEAATMPVVYTTVLRSLIDKAHLKEGQSVLIHSATGGVGIAALHVARWIGATVYATAGTEEKRAFLAREYGIPADHIFDSRTPTFEYELRKATAGRGVDVVLNSLSGELLHASWRCVASAGCMVELGKQDIVGRAQLAMDCFSGNRAFIGVDMNLLAEEDAPTIQRLMAQTVQLYRDGAISPITPMTTFDAEKVQDGFRYMQKGLHMGKVVIEFPGSNSLPLAHSMQNMEFRPDVSYLLVGGTGGLGKGIATWMASHGAEHLIFASRSAGKSNDDQAFFQELEEMGCHAQAFSCDVSNAEDVQNVIESATRPIAGVLQMAMVLKDVSFLDMDIDSWNAAVEPKVQGTWNLHELLPKDLDFFVLFSSLSGTCGFWGQANYASANTFLSSFTQYRQQLGLPASVLEIGAVEDIGFLTRNPKALRNLRSSMDRMLSEPELLNSLHLAISRCLAQQSSDSTAQKSFNDSQITIGLNPTQDVLTQSGRTDPRISSYRIQQRDSGFSTTSTTRSQDAPGSLQKFLAKVKSHPATLDRPDTAEFLAQEIGAQIFQFLGEEKNRPIDISLRLTDIGSDSLVAIELRNWWRGTFQSEVSLLEMLNRGTIHGLGVLALEQLRRIHQ